MCKLNLPVYILDCLLFLPQQVEHYDSAALHAKYEQYAMKTADIKIQALDLVFI